MSGLGWEPSSPVRSLPAEPQEQNPLSFIALWWSHQAAGSGGREAGRREGGARLLTIGPAVLHPTPMGTHPGQAGLQLAHPFASGQFRRPP